MTLTDFPPDVQAAAKAAHAEFANNRVGENLGVIIARAIMDDRAVRIDVSGLTARQADCLRFIVAHQHENDGITPSYAEIADGLGLVSKSGVLRLLRALERRGRILRPANQSRAITILTPTPGA
jgi:DNA-binding CsgD family transcriptional regulator